MARSTPEGREKYRAASRKCQEARTADGRAAEYCRTRYAEDPQYKVAKCLRNILSQALRRHRKATGTDTRKRAKTFTLVGCTVEHLFDHLTAQFEPGMTFYNIHIDHIRPLSSFADPDDPEAWHWTNLRPLWPQDNMSKGSLWEGERHRFR